MIIKERLRVVRPKEEPKDLSNVIVDGLHRAETTLFGHCKTVQTRLERLGRVINVLEESLTSPEAMQELRNKPMGTRFDYYNAFTKVMVSMIGYMERIHDIAADQAKFNAIRDQMKALTTDSVVTPEEGQVQIVQSRESVSQLMELLKEEMSIRSRG